MNNTVATFIFLNKFDKLWISIEIIYPRWNSNKVPNFQTTFTDAKNTLDFTQISQRTFLSKLNLNFIINEKAWNQNEIKKKI